MYQEQVMQIVRNLAGYTLGRSDLVRRAMSKKKQQSWRRSARTLFMETKRKAYQAVLPMEFRKQTANKIYDDMIDFAKIRI